MGYSHYWERSNKPVTDKKWNAFIADVQKIFTAHDDIICRELDVPNRKPIVNDTEVWFNGKGDDGHETCVIRRDFEQVAWRTDKEPSFTFCKTAHKPYDEVVVAVLSCLHHHIPMFKISSDGGKEAFPAYKDLVERYNLEIKPKKSTT